MGAELIGSVISGGLNMANNAMVMDRQSYMNAQKYEDMVGFARKYGATPTSIISGITGSAGGAFPAVSTSNNPVADFGSVMNQSEMAKASHEQAAASAKEAEAATVRAETERQLGLMRLKFEPKKYFADIQKSLAEAFESTKHAFLHGSMKEYYNELAEDIRQVRPWKIAGLAQGLLNDMATFDKIIQETKTSKAQESYYYAGAKELETRSDLNTAQSQYYYAHAMNENLRGFRLQWENTLLSYGIDPNKPFFENTARLMYTNPKLFSERMNIFISSLNSIDSKLQDNLGEHYKRNIALGYGLYQLNNIHQKNANNRAWRFNKYGSTISSFIPFAGGSSSLGDNAGVDWWLKD